MHSKKPIQHTFNLGLVIFFIAACGKASPSPAPVAIIPSTDIPPEPSPTIMPTAIAPTSTQAGTAITDVQVILGNWRPLGGERDDMFLQLNQDGTCRQSSVIGGLTSSPEVECTYELMASMLTFTEVKVNGIPKCGSTPVTYKVESLSEHLIRLTAIQDGCTGRRKSTQGEYQRLP